LPDPAHITDLESPQRHEQILEDKKIERKREAVRLAGELKRSILDIKVKKKTVRREIIINEQYNKMILANDNKFKQFMKGMRGYR